MRGDRPGLAPTILCAAAGMLLGPAVFLVVMLLGR
jgi:hypothetical protein